MSFKKCLMLICTLFFTASLSASGKPSEKVVLTPENVVVFRGEVTATSVAQVMAQIMSHPKDELYLFINSPGGSILDGIRLVNLLNSTEKKVTCITNFAASMAFVILQACPRRLVTDDAIVMQHVASYGISGQEPNNVSMVNFLQRMIEKLDKDQAKRIGISLEKFRSLTRNDWWLFDGEVVKNGVADAAATVTCNAELAKKTTSQTFRILFFTAEVVWSDCPLIEGPLSVKAGMDLSNEADQEAFIKFNEDLNWRNKLLSGKKK